MEMEMEMEMEMGTEVKSIEDLRTEGEEGVLCSVCEELLSGPGFKCPGCPFLCHKSCGILEMEIEHPLHPEHSHELLPPLRYAYCYDCGKPCGSCPSYACRKCHFRLDTKCVSRWRVKKDSCDSHALVPLVEQIQFTCNFCGEEGKGNGCLCSLCRLTIHSKCAPFLRTIKISNHPHPLKLRYSAHEVEEQEEEEEEENEDDEREEEEQEVEEQEEEEEENEDDELEEEEQEVEEQEEEENEDDVLEEEEQEVEEQEEEEENEDDELEEEEQEVEEQEEQKVEAKEEQEIEEKKEQGDMKCKLCFGKLNANYAFYYCREYKYAAHLRCASDREVEQRNEIFWSITMESQGYFACLIKDKNQAVIKSSLARVINHFSHQHELILDSEEVTDNKICEGCMQPISVPFSSCMRCDLFLHS